MDSIGFPKRLNRRILLETLAQLKATPRKKLRRDPMLQLELKKHWLLGMGSLHERSLAVATFVTSY